MSVARPLPRGPLAEPLFLDDLVESARAHLVEQPVNALLRVTGDPPLVEGLHLHDEHPLESLFGFIAPVEWRAIGLHAAGLSYELDDPDDGGPPATGVSFTQPTGDSVPVTVTLLIDRTGQGCGVLYDGHERRQLNGLPDGIVGDACRRALGLATAAPPGGTAGLWLHVWLDRIVDVGTTAAQRRRGPLSWNDTTLLHPSNCGLGAVPAPHDVVEATYEMAAAWPWSRLRLDPEVVDTGRPPLQRTIAAWMDDGMYARWTRSELGALDRLGAEARRLLDPEACDQLVETFDLCGAVLPGGEEADR